MKRLILILIFTMAAAGRAQDTLSLGQAIEYALANNHMLSMARNSAVIAGNNRSAGNAGFLPRLDVNGSQSNSINNTNLEFISGEKVDKTGAKSNAFNTSARLTWNIFDGLEQFNSYGRLGELEEISYLEMVNLREMVIENVIRSYFEIVRRKQLTGVATETLGVSEKRAGIQREKYELGSASRIELLESVADMNSDSSALIAAAVMVENQKITLCEIMGKEPTCEFAVAGKIKLRSRIAWDSIRNVALENNPEIRIARGREKVAGHNLRTEYSELYPEVNLFANYDYSTSESEAGFVQSSTNYGVSYGLNFSINLFNGLNTRRRIENSQIMLENSRIELERTIMRIESQLLRAYNNYRKNLKLVEFETQNFDVARQRLDLAVERMKLGTISSVQFREAQRSYAAARGRIIEARYATRISEAELIRIAGGFSEYK
jgi:outer membrane protein TolC